MLVRKTLPHTRAKWDSGSRYGFALATGFLGDFERRFYAVEATVYGEGSRGLKS